MKLKSFVYKEDLIMEYKIIGQTVPVVEMKLNRGETVYTQSGGMAYQT